MQLKDTKNIMDKIITEYIDSITNLTKKFFIEPSTINNYKFFFPNIVHYSFILQYLNIPTEMKKELINILLKFNGFYFKKNYSLFNGLPLLSMILLINKEIIKEDYYALQKKIIFLINNIKISNKEFKDIEYINGISGLLNYYLILNELEPCILSAKSYLRINQIIDLILEYDKTKINNLSSINFSLSHGIAGILLVLVKSLKYNYKKKEIEKQILFLQKLLINNYILYSNKIPGIVSKNEIIFPKNTPSWCYSELGVLHAIIKSFKIYSNKNYLETIFRKEIQKILSNKSNYKLISSNFCHGFSGALVFFTLYQVNNKEIKEYLLSEIKSLYDKKLICGFYDLYYNKSGNICSEINFSFLDGSISVLLSLLYSKGKNNTIWENMLLLK